MIVTCPSCQSKYSIGEEKIRGRSARIRCRTCGEAIAVSGHDLDVPPARGQGVRAYASPFDDAPSGAAVLPREGARAKRDLFAAIPEQDAYAPETREPLYAAAPTGERNETSVLFTLATLSGNRGLHAPAASKKEDSGVFDLNAMMAQGAELSTKSVRAAPLSEPPLGAFTTEVTSSLPAVLCNRRVRYAGITLALVALLGLGIAATRGESADVASVTPAVAAAAPAPPPPPEAVPAPVPAADAVAEAKVAALPVATPAPKAKGKKHAGGPGKSAASRKAASASAPPAPRAPAANDPCGCKGNLMCAMKCSS